MTVRAYNKVTREWASTEDGSDLPGIAGNWILDPQFVDEAYAMSVPSALWTFDGVNVLTPTPEEFAAIQLTATRDSIWRAIQDERTRRQNGGARVVAVNKWFHSDSASRIQQLGLLLFGNNMPTGIMWKTMDGSFIEMTPQLAQAIFAAVANLDVTSFGVAEQHRANMLAAQDPTTYNFQTGWPTIFGE